MQEKHSEPFKIYGKIHYQRKSLSRTLPRVCAMKRVFVKIRYEHDVLKKESFESIFQTFSYIFSNYKQKTF